MASFPTIKNIKTFVIQGVGSGGDYHNVKGGHWLIGRPVDAAICCSFANTSRFQNIYVNT
jgi:hypothetical protein